MDVTQPIEQYDAVVVGGGPAGIAAAVNLARARRGVAVVDCERTGRSSWAQVNHNYLGFPDGISIVDLCALGRQQAERYGARFYEAEVASLTREADDTFCARARGLALRCRGVVLATGVTDRWITFTDYEACIGRSLHWCIHCDGYEMAGQRVVVVGNDEEAAEMATQLLAHTDQVTLVTNSGALGLGPETVKALAERGIPLVVGRIAEARVREVGRLEAILIDDHPEVAVDHLFSAQGAVPNSELARSLGVRLSGGGYIEVDAEAHTSVRGVFAAGDVTRLFAHQVQTAAHEGSTAAAGLDYFLFQQDRAAGRDARHGAPVH